MLIEPAFEPIELPVSDRVFQDTILKQKAWYDVIEIRQLRGGGAEAVLWVEVRAYARLGEGYGEPLPPGTVMPRRIGLRADNNTAVTPEGELRYLLINEAQALNLVTGATEPITTDWHDFLRAKDESLYLQGDLFAQLRDRQDVRIRHLILLHITNADAMGRFL